MRTRYGRNVALLATALVVCEMVGERSAQADLSSAAEAVSIITIISGVGLIPAGAVLTASGVKTNSGVQKGVGIAALTVGGIALITGIIGTVMFHNLYDRTTIVTPALTYRPTIPMPIGVTAIPVIGPTELGRGGMVGVRVSF